MLISLLPEVDSIVLLSPLTSIWSSPEPDKILLVLPVMFISFEPVVVE